MRSRITVGILVFALVFYMALIGVRAEWLFDGNPTHVGLGIAALLILVVGVVLIVFELRFGAATARLARELAEEGDLPDDSGIEYRPSGRVDRVSADAHFETVKVRVEADPENWRGWYQLAYAYDLAGDRRRGRSAMRRAIELHV